MNSMQTFDVMALWLYRLTFCLWHDLLVLRFGGENTFDDNWGYKGGAIYNEPEAFLSPPEDGGDLVFENIRGTVGACYACLYSGVSP